jgi:hypothetical protein
MMSSSVPSPMYMARTYPAYRCLTLTRSQSAAIESS